MPNFWDYMGRTLPAAYQQSQANWQRQQFYQQQLEEERRKERIAAAKERAAAKVEAAKQRQKQHQQFIDAMKQEKQRNAELNRRFRIANAQLGSYLNSGHIKPDDFELMMEQVESAPNDAAALKLVRQTKDLARFRKTGGKGMSAPELFNLAWQEYTTTGVAGLSPWGFKLLESFAGQGEGLPEELPGGVRTIPELRNAQKIARAEKLLEEALGIYEENARKASTPLSRERREMIPEGGQLGDIVTFEEWMQRGEQKRKYGEAWNLIRLEYMKQGNLLGVPLNPVGAGP